MDSYQLARTRPLSSYSFFCFCFIICSCSPQETVDFAFNIQQGEQGFALRKIHFFDDENGIAMGGVNYLFGVAQFTEDGGETWTLDTVSQKIVRDFDVEEDRIYGVGIDNFITKKEGLLPWQELASPERGESNGLLKTDSGFILAGGIAIQFGFVITLSDDFAESSRTELLGEINAIERSSDQMLHMVGFGSIYRSDDGGQTWIANEQDGDDYRDVFFINENIGWVVGNAGSILKTEDSGLSWNTINEPTTLNKLRINKIHFMNELDGVLVGDSGLVMISKDGGENWVVIEGLPDVDYCSVFISEDFAWVGSDEGHILKVSISEF